MSPEHYNVLRGIYRPITLLSVQHCTAHPILFGDKIEKNVMDGACSAYGGGERLIKGFGFDIRTSKDRSKRMVY